NFLATPFIVPAPCSYSRRICSYNSTLTLLFSKPFLPSGLESPKQDTRFLVYRGPNQSIEVGQFRVANSICLNCLVDISLLVWWSSARAFLALLPRIPEPLATVALPQSSFLVVLLPQGDRCF